MRPPPDAEELQFREKGRYYLRPLQREESALAQQLYAESGEPTLSTKAWDWRFYQRNPLISMVPGLFTKKEDKLVALYPVTLRPVRVAGLDLLTCQACRTLIHPEHRGATNYLSLMRFMYDRAWSMGVHFGLGGGANEAALKVGKKLMNYVEMHTLNTRERRLSFQMNVRKRWGAKPASLFRKMEGPMFTGLRYEYENYRVEIAEQADAGFDELWQRLKDQYVGVLRRDAREIQWRWFDCPVPAKVLVLKRKDSRDYEGYLALRVHQDRFGAGRICTVLDLFTQERPEAVEALLAAAGAWGRSKRSDFLHFAPAPNTVAYKVTAQKPWRTARLPADHVVLCQCCYDPKSVGLTTVLPKAMAGANWYYCQGDSDFLD